MERGLVTVSVLGTGNRSDHAEGGSQPFPVLPAGRAVGPIFFGEPSMDFLLVDSPPRSDWWPVVKMADGTLRKGPYAEIIGRWK